MATIISIPNDNDPVMNQDRRRISSWASQHGWIYVGYNDPVDHILQIRTGARGAALQVLDFNCHGSPVSFDGTYLNSVRDWGKILSQLPGFSRNTVVYLDACNTGLQPAVNTTGPIIAQELATAAGCIVFGSQGYVTGTFAEGTARCTAALGAARPFPGGRDAEGAGVWKAFQPQSHPIIPRMPEETSINLPQDNGIVHPLKSRINTILSGPVAEFPLVRMAPDITINYPRGTEVWILDVYGNGSLVRDRISGKTYKVEDPDGLLEMVRGELGRYG